MKNSLQLLAIMIALLIIAGSLKAQEDPLDSRMKTYTFPNISLFGPVVVDGIADEEFWSKVEYAEIDTFWVNPNGNVIVPDNQADCWVKWKAVWDEDNFYIFAEVTDDSRQIGVKHLSDNFEMYFNVDSSQHNKDGYTNLTASQVRANYGYNDSLQTVLLSGGGYCTTAGDATNYLYKSANTDNGWNIEVRIPMALVIPDPGTIAHDFTAEEGSMIEFEVNIGDCDDLNRLVNDVSVPREHIGMWNAKNSNAFKDVDVFAVCHLGKQLLPEGTCAPEDPADSRMRTYTFPNVSDFSITIDGLANEAFWSEVEYAEIDTFWVNPNGNVIVPDNQADCWVKWKAVWDEDNFYIFAEVTDDSRQIGVKHLSDNFEMFFNVDCQLTNKDGYTNLTASQVRANYGYNDSLQTVLLSGGGYCTTAGDATNYLYKSADTDNGWNIEVRIPMALVIPDPEIIAHNFTAEVGSLIEFEVNIGDCDDLNRLVNDVSVPREHIGMWNAKNNNGFKDVDLFAICYLGEAVETSTHSLETHPGIKVYPLPASNLLMLDIDDYSNVKEVTIFNCLGQNVKIIEQVEAKNHIDISNLSPGIYFISIRNYSREIKTLKVLKQ